MNKKEKYLLLYQRLFDLYGECECPLKHNSPFQLLAAVMLSAQCRDERVNQVTEKLFAIAPNAQSMSKLPVETIEALIHPCGLSNAKSRNLHKCAVMIEQKFNGEVPMQMDELVKLPGIGRKSANVVLGNAFNIPGFPVDTHVRRVLNRIGTVKSDSPEKIEAEVNQQMPPEYWTNFSHLIIQHGRKVCSSAKPKCSECTISDVCRKVNVKK